MIHCQANFFSKILMNHVDVDVLLPSMPDNDILFNDLSTVYPKGCEHPVLYLLHGALEDHSSWLRQTCVERYAEHAGIAVVMASAQNGFYANARQGHAYFDFFTKELPDFIAYTFPVSRRREDTFVAGASMGGYGAAKLALSCPESYSSFGCFSGAVDPEKLESKMVSQGYDVFRYDLIFGGASKVTGSSDDLKVLAASLADSDIKPDAFVTCGLEEANNYEMVSEFRDVLVKSGFQVRFTDGHGEHDWDYWERCIALYMEHLAHIIDQGKAV